jgi:sorbitol/mannitol transport system substrate-binding protein
VGGATLSNPAESQVAGKVGFANAPIAVTPKGSHWLWSWAFAMPKAAKSPDAAKKFALWATSKAYIELAAKDSGWASVPPGTRKSTYDNPEYQKSAPFASITMQAMNSADPKSPTLKPVPYTGVQFVGIPEFQSFGTVVGQSIAGALAGKMSVDEALKAGQAAANRAVKQAGYQK